MYFQLPEFSWCSFEGSLVWTDIEVGVEVLVSLKSE